MTNEPMRPPLPLGPLELPGQTVDDDISLAITKYGIDAVKDAVKRRSKRGRPKVKEGAELKLLIEEDARFWLEGGDPFARRKNYSIAKAVADSKPGHSHPSTMKRIERKLNGKPYGRTWLTLVTAMQISRREYSYEQHLRVLQALKEEDPAGTWDIGLDLALGYVAAFTKWHGQPAKELTMEQVEEGAKAPVGALLTPPTRPREGLFGSRF